jgi:glycosyltransferase involved in cell wall biosynthesis
MLLSLEEKRSQTPRVPPGSGSRLLLLNSARDGFAAESGYQVLARHLPGAETLSRPRRAPRSLLARTAGRALRLASLSGWYQGSSAALEWQAARRLLRGFEGIVHYLWADSDCGYLDRLPAARAARLLGTFHCCADELPGVVRRPGRLRSFAGLVLMSESQRPFFLAHGVPASRLHVVLHGVSADHFRPDFAARGGRFEVLSVGGYRRNFRLLRGVCDLLAGEAGVAFRVVAPPRHRDVFAGAANVVFESGLSDAELLARYRGASCLLFTAENATANNALLEGLSCGLPVVGERVGGVPEYATPDCARLTDPGDVAGLAAAIRQLARSPAAAEELSLAARRRAEGLDWTNVARDMGRLYDSL